MKPEQFMMAMFWTDSPLNFAAAGSSIKVTPEKSKTSLVAVLLYSRIFAMTNGPHSSTMRPSTLRVTDEGVSAIFVMRNNVDTGYLPVVFASRVPKPELAAQGR
jgi:hypothetical protein